MSAPPISTTSYESPGQSGTGEKPTASATLSEPEAPTPYQTAHHAEEDSGFRRIEALYGKLSISKRALIFFSVFLVAYAYSLDSTLRYAYQPVALGNSNDHPMIPTINVLRSVIGAAAQLTAARVADIFGRVELIIVSIFFYVLGTIIQTASQGFASYAAGTVIYQAGYTMVMLLVEVIIADLTSTRARLVFSYVPVLPFLINTWISGTIASFVLDATHWRWGFGMWCIIYPICTLPLMVSLVVISKRAADEGLLRSYKTPLQALRTRDFFLALWHRLDAIGILLLVAALALILIPLTLTGGYKNSWGTAKVFVPLVLGVLLVPVLAAVGIAVLLNITWTIQASNLYTLLVVAFGYGFTDAARITSLYSFAGVIVGPLLGLLVFKIRRLKVLIFSGTCLFTVAFGLMIHYRGATAVDGGRTSIIAAQAVLGIAGGMFPHPTQASLQVQQEHKDLAVMTGAYLAMCNIGAALGNTISGIIWSHALPKALMDSGLPLDIEVAAYVDPLGLVPHFPGNTYERQVMVKAYRSTQLLIAITGVCLCLPLIGFAAALKNPKLNDEQNVAPENKEAVGSETT